MTTPGSGPLSFSQISPEFGQAPTYSATMSWIRDNTKPGQQSNSLSGYYSKAYYQRNVDGNCNNGNCTSNCNCGNIQCTNCVIAGGVNCANCDARPWLQSNCNCACTYNCSTGLTSYNCNCDCNCICGSCFLEGSLVWMEDGSFQPIEDVRIGDRVRGWGGMINTVVAYDRPLLGDRPLFCVNGEHDTTDEHPHFGYDRVYAVSVESLLADRSVEHELTLADGQTVRRVPPHIARETLAVLEVGAVLTTVSGLRRVDTLEEHRLPASTQLFNLAVDGSRTYFVNGYLVSGWAGDFNYTPWST